MGGEELTFDLSFKSTLIILHVTWFISVIITNASIVDLIWGALYAVNAFCAIYSNYSSELEQSKLILMILVGLVVSIHGLRLTYYLCKRNIGHGEDKRYQVFRKKYGEKRYWWISYFQVYGLQGLISLIVSSIFRSAINKIVENNDYNKIYVILGAAIAFLGTIYQGIADEQLFAFKSDIKNKGKLLTTGLWKYSRHPNYFGEILFFWGIYLISISLGDYTKFYSPIVMSLLLRYVSGVPLLEKGMKKNSYSEEFKDYVSSTKMLIPYLL